MSQAAPAAQPASGASAPGASLIPDGTGAITTAHLILIGLFALLVVAAIVYGVRLKQRRHAARRDLIEHNEALPDQAPTAALAPASVGDGAAASGPVTQLKGLGPKLADRLAELGITTVGQVAALTDDQAQALDAQLGPFAGRLARDRWLEQARFLAADDRAGFEAVFGRL